MGFVARFQSSKAVRLEMLWCSPVTIYLPLGSDFNSNHHLSSFINFIKASNQPQIYMKSRVNIGAETDLELTRVKNMFRFFVAASKFSTICSRCKMSPQRDVKKTLVCGIKLACLFFNTFPWQSDNFAGNNDKKNSKATKLDNL